MLTNYYNLYRIASLHPCLSLFNFIEDEDQGWCEGTYMVPFTLKKTGSNFTLGIQNNITNSSKWKGFSRSLRGGSLCVLEAPTLKGALRRALEVLDYALFTNFLDAVENQTFVLPYSTNPIRFSDVDEKKLSAKGYVNHHKAILAFRPQDRTPYKIRIATPNGKVVFDAHHLHSIQKMLRSFRG